MKLVRHDSEPPSPGAYRGRAAPGVSAAQRARDAAVEKALARYTTLACGHITTREEILSYLAWATDPLKRCYCEKCGKYVAVKPPATAAVVPEEPMF